MNLLFLVEGKTETIIYKRWLNYLFPNLTAVNIPEDMKNNTYRIISSGGYPEILKLIKGCLSDIENYDNVDHFFICIDSEQYSYNDRFDEVKAKLDSLKTGYNIDSLKTQIYIIIQNCCIETWALGNDQIPNCYNAKNSSKTWSNYQAYYDVLLDDPEKMPCCPSGYHARPIKPRFHKSYLEEYFKKYGLLYTKSDPGIVQTGNYLDALINRCQKNHLSSLKYLLDILDSI